MTKNNFINDRYKKARGGYSRFLDISCAKCGQPYLLLSERWARGFEKDVF